MKKIALVCTLLAALCMIAFAGEAVDVGARNTASKTPAVSVPADVKVLEPSQLKESFDALLDKEAADKAAQPVEDFSHMNLNGPLDDCTTPFPETFESAAVPALPDCWVQFNVNGDTKMWKTVSTGGHNGPKVARIDYGSVAHDDWLISPAVSLTAANTYALKFWYKGNSTSYIERLEVFYGTTQDVAGMTTNLVPVIDIQTTTWTQSTTNFQPPADGVYYIGFHAISVANQYYLFLDDVELGDAFARGRCCYGPDPCAPLCDFNMAAECAALGGTWTEGVECGDPITCAVPEPRDLCCNAEALTIPASVTGNNTTANSVTLPACGPGAQMGKEHWFTVIGDGTTYTASTCNAGTNFDTEIQVWTGDCANLVCVGGNDDAGSTLCPDYSAVYVSMFSWCALPDVTYYILVGSYSSSSTAGNYQLDVTSDGISCLNPLGRCCYGNDPEIPECATVTESECVALTGEWTVGEACLPEFPYGCPLPLHGDVCADALHILALPYVDTRDNTGAADDYNGAPACLAQAYYDDGMELVYDFVVTEQMCITITLDQGTDYDYCSVSLWNGCPDVGTCLAGAYAGTGVMSIPCTVLEPGTYYIMVDNWPTPDVFEYTLTVDACECPSPCETYVLCGTPAEIEPNDVCPAPELQPIIGCDVTVYGLICPASDVDYWHVIVPPMSKMLLGQFEGAACDVNPTVVIATGINYDDCTVAAAGPNYSGWNLSNSGLVPWEVFVKVSGNGVGLYSLSATCCPLYNPCTDPIVINVGDYNYEATVNTCPTDPCGTANVVAGVWEDACAGSAYTSGPDAIFMLTLYETANDITITALGAASADEQVMVFTDCTDPMGSCVASQDMFGGNAEGEVIANAVLTPGTYYISVSYYGSTGCGDITLTINSDVILPVEFGDVDVVMGDREVTLNWNTVTETNTDRFEIVRDGVVKGTVDAAGNSATNRNYSWTEEGLDNGVEYTYTLKVVDLGGAVRELATVNAIPSFENGMVTEYALHQNYPNPFNPATTIAFDLKEAGFVNLKIYNLMGQEVATVMNGSMNMGRHLVSFDASNLSSGIYLYRIEVNGFAAEKKMLLMK